MKLFQSYMIIWNTMIKINYTNKFKKSYSKFVKKYPYLQSKIDIAIEQLRNWPFFFYFKLTQAKWWIIWALFL